MRLPAVATVLLLSATGCVKEISSDQRMEEGSPKYSSSKETPDANTLSKVHCDDTGDALTNARNVNIPETDRLSRYVDLYSSLVKRNATFEDAMTRNPDLKYTEGSQALVAARDACIQQTADVKVEFETYVRELVDVPTVQEIKGGNTVVVPRLDFSTLRQAIDTLAPDDKEQMLAKVTNAEKKVATTEETPNAPAAAGRGRRGK